jgi:hypothetical protein
MTKIKIKRGLEANLGSLTLEDGELAITTDNHKLYVGVGGAQFCIGSASSLGDMLKSIYDTDNDGVVDKAEVAAKLATARTIALTSGATGSATFDGSNNASIAVTVTADGHDHTRTRSVDDRDVRPTNVNKGYSALYFTSLAGLNGTADSDYQDFLALNAYTDASGGKVNALAFDKSEMKIRHYQAAQSDTAWGTAKELAYTDHNHNSVYMAKGPVTWAQLKG